MDVSATAAKNRLGQMLDIAQHEPVFIEKSGRRHGVLISAARYEALLAAAAPAERVPRSAREFYARYQAWVDEENRRFETAGVWNLEQRSW